MSTLSKFRKAMSQRRWGLVKDIIELGVKNSYAGFRSHDGIEKRMRDVVKAKSLPALTAFFSFSTGGKFDLDRMFTYYSVIESVWSGDFQNLSQRDKDYGSRHLPRCLRLSIENDLFGAVEAFVTSVDLSIEQLEDGLCHAARNGKLDSVALISKFSSPKAGLSQAIRLAVSYCNFDCIEFLIPLSNPEHFALSAFIELYPRRGIHQDPVFSWARAGACEMAEKMFSLIPPGTNVQEAAKHAVLNDSVALLSKIATRSDLVFDINKVIIEAAKHGHIEVLRKAIAMADPKCEHSEALISAATYGYAECVRLLIPVSDPKAEGSQALLNAAGGRHKECVAALMSVSDVRAQDDMMISLCAKSGWNDLATILLAKGLDPRNHNSAALRFFSEKGDVKMVNMFLPFSNPSELNCESLRLAIARKHLKIIEILAGCADSAWDRSCAIYAAAWSMRASMRQLFKEVDSANILSYLTIIFKLEELAPAIKKMIDDTINVGDMECFKHLEVYEMVKAFEERREFEELILAPPTTPQKKSNRL